MKRISLFIATCTFAAVGVFLGVGVSPAQAANSMVGPCPSNVPDGMKKANFVVAYDDDDFTMSDGKATPKDGNFYCVLVTEGADETNTFSFSFLVQAGAAKIHWGDDEGNVEYICPDGDFIEGNGGTDYPKMKSADDMPAKLYEEVTCMTEEWKDYGDGDGPQKVIVPKTQNSRIRYRYDYGPDKYVYFMGFGDISPGIDIYGSYGSTKIKKSCGTVPPGKKYVIFVVADDSMVTGYPNHDPVGGTQTCVLVDKTQTVASFQNLVEGGIIAQNFGSPDMFTDGAKVSKQTVSCEKDNLWDGEFKNADQWEYLLSENTTVNCGSHGPAKRVRYRFDIEYDGTEDEKFLYYIGDFDPKKHSSLPEANQLADGAVCQTYKTVSDCRNKSPKTCFWHTQKKECFWRFDNSVCDSLQKPLCGTDIGSTICKWNDTLDRCITSIDQQQFDDYAKPEGYDGPLPDCAFSGQCRDINDLLQLGINIGRFIFGLIGMLALAMFVYGGFFLVFSLGNPEKVKKGSGILLGAVIGMIIAFGAYILIDFILDALGVADTFRGVK